MRLFSVLLRDLHNALPALNTIMSGLNRPVSFQIVSIVKLRSNARLLLLSLASYYLVTSKV